MDFIDHAADIVNRIDFTFSTILFGMAGLMLVCIGGWSTFHSIRFLRWPKAAATIVRYHIRRSHGKPNEQAFFRPVVKFKTADGQEIVALSDVGIWRRPWERGSTVTVHYNPKNPRWAVIRCFATVWGMPLTSAILLIVFGCMLFYKFR